MPVAAGVAQAISWLQARLPEHWNSTENIYVTFGGPAAANNPPLTPGYDPNVDIVMACIYGAIPCTDTQMLATAARIRSQWTDPASTFAYPINAADTARGVGPLMGRYPDDRYDGDSARRTRWATRGCRVRLTSPSCTTRLRARSAISRLCRWTPCPPRSSAH
jgi:glucoamylase